MILLIDNYDSFVHNLARYIRLQGEVTQVIRSDQITVQDIAQLNTSAIVISPGPKSPNEAGVSLACVRHFSGRIPILGVCLGHQCIGAAFGAKIVKGEPVHGRASSINHCGEGVFVNIPTPMSVGRYHSLIIERQSLPQCLKILADTADGTIMAVRHRTHPTVGVQFHPESVLSTEGANVIRNFLTLVRSDRQFVESPVGAGI